MLHNAFLPNTLPQVEIINSRSISLQFNRNLQWFIIYSKGQAIKLLQKDPENQENNRCLKIENYREEEMDLMKATSNGVQVVICIWFQYSREEWEASWINSEHHQFLPP